MSSKMLLLLLSNQVLCLYLISKPPKDGLFVMPSFIYYPLLLCFKLQIPAATFTIIFSVHISLFLYEFFFLMSIHCSILIKIILRLSLHIVK